MKEQSWLVFETKAGGRFLTESEYIEAICVDEKGEIIIGRPDKPNIPQVITGVKGFDNLATAVSCVLGLIDVSRPKINAPAS